MAYIEEPAAVVSVLLAVIACLFAASQHPVGERLFRVVPLLVFLYFVPTSLSNVGLIPLASPAYEWIKDWLLPASLALLTMSVDIPALVRLGRPVLVMFLGGTASIVIGGPVALLLCRGLLPVELGDQAWKGLAALSGSWIGGGANFVAIGESVGASDSTLGAMIVVDVFIANIWMAVLLFTATHEKRLDARIGADRRTLEEVRERLEAFRLQSARQPTLADLCTITALGLGAATLSTYLASFLPDLGGVLGKFAWTVILVTAFAIAASFTPLRRLEGAGASRVGSLFLYLLVASIGAKAEFERVFDAPGLIVIGAVWIAIHALVLWLLRYLMKVPIFFLAVGSQANVGGAASAPIVASAFQPELAPVGALMGVAGYVLGTYAGLVCAYLLQWVYQWGGGL
jgi:uncharacterized membrane protein